MRVEKTSQERTGYEREGSSIGAGRSWSHVWNDIECRSDGGSVELGAGSGWSR